MDKKSIAMIPSFTSISDPYPNVQKNRIPVEAELASLKSLLGAYSHLVIHLKVEVKRAKMSHESILARYQHQIRELESTRSQLDESKKALQSIEEQYNVLQAETGQLAGAIHPIRRFPFELLQHIFELAHDHRGPRRLQTTHRLSQVCQRWRRVVHDSPRLWSCIRYTMDKEDSNISAFWNVVILRMKAVTPSLVIRGVEADKLERLKHLSLHLIPLIHSLELNLTDPSNFECLAALADLLPATEIESLEIKWEKGEKGDEEDAIWDLGVALKGGFIPPKLTLGAASILRLTPSTHFGSVTTLILMRLREVDVPLILSLFGQLNTLQLHQVFTCSAVGQPILSSSLSCLVIGMDPQENGMGWLARVSCPNLTSLHCDATEFPNDFVSFVERHHSLKTLDYDSRGKLVARLASVASQVQHLDITVKDIGDFLCWETAGMQEPPFPALKTLGISRTSRLQRDDFESIVQARCLPRHHPNCKVPLDLVPLASLSISELYGNNKRGDIRSWNTSRFFKEAQKSAMIDPIWLTNGITLSWM